MEKLKFNNDSERLDFLAMYYCDILGQLVDVLDDGRVDKYYDIKIEEQNIEILDDSRNNKYLIFDLGFGLLIEADKKIRETPIDDYPAVRIEIDLHKTYKNGKEINQ